MNTELYPTKELARITGIKENTIRTWKSKGRLASSLWTITGNSLLWKHSAIAAVLNLASKTTAKQSHEPSSEHYSATRIDIIENAIAEILAEDYIAKAKEQVSTERIRSKALQIASTKLVADLKAEITEQTKSRKESVCNNHTNFTSSK